MKKILIVMFALMLISSVYMVAATDVGTGVGVNIITQQFTPRVFLCGNRTTIDDNVENGANGLSLAERKNNYAFEGEQIHWLVFVMDKNKIEAVTDVVGTMGNTSATSTSGNDPEVECTRLNGDPFGNSTVNLTNTLASVTCTASVPNPATGVNITCSVNGVNNSTFTGVVGLLGLSVNGTNISVNVGSGIVNFSTTIGGTNGNCSVNNLTAGSNGSCSFSITNTTTMTTGGDPFAECNARVDQFNVTSFDPSTMAYYDCTFTVEDPSSMHGEKFLTVEAKTSDASVSGIMHENEYWFLNPMISLDTDGDMTFNDGNGIMPGTTTYSNTVILTNGAENGSGVMMDMFISGTDFYDSTPTGAKCPSTNQLALTNFGYYATNGAYSTIGDVGADSQGYLSIPYSTDISGAMRIIRDPANPAALLIRGSSPSSSVWEGDWNNGNALSQGASMPITFKLNLPEPCTGNFDQGRIYFWGEAI